MKSPLKKSIGEVVTDYGARVMKVFKKGLLQRSLFDFYGDVKADKLRVKESASVPATPIDKDGGVIYIKSSDGKLYYKSNEVSEIELSSSGATLTTEQVQDIVGAMFSGNTETNITVTYQDADGTIDLAATDTNTTYSEATGSAEGLMSIAHHDKLDGIESGATADQTQADINGLAITTVGTIDTGTWEGTVIADAYLSSNTAHLSGTQTFSGTKTFSNTISGSIDGNAATATTALGVAGSTDTDVSITSDGDITITIDNDGDETDSIVLFRSRTVEIGRIDEVGNATFPGIITGKQRQIYQQSFIDDLGTDKHYLPWRDTDEQTTIWQEEAAMIAPYDGRIVSVTMRMSSIASTGNRTIGIHTIGPNTSQFSSGSWTEEEVEQVATENTDDNHVFYFVFDNAKHFESGELVVLSIQDDTDLTTGSRYTYISTVVEWDYNNGLGTGASSAEYDSAQ